MPERNMPSQIVHTYRTGNTHSSLAMTIPKIVRETLGLSDRTPLQVTSAGKDSFVVKKLDLEHMTAAEYVDLQRSQVRAIRKSAQK